jgi:hypothetical protein
MVGSHLPVDYRGEFEHDENRFGPPGEVCDTCSDFNAGRLVPVSFCPNASAAADQYYDWQVGDGPRPEWLDGPDAMVVKF